MRCLQERSVFPARRRTKGGVMTNSVVLSEVDSDTVSVTAQSVQSDIGGLTSKLKVGWFQLRVG